MVIVAAKRRETPNRRLFRFASPKRSTTLQRRRAKNLHSSKNGGSRTDIKHRMSVIFLSHSEMSSAEGEAKTAVTLG